MKKCHLSYDRLHVDGEVYLFNEVEGRVEPVKMRLLEGELLEEVCAQVGRDNRPMLVSLQEKTLARRRRPRNSLWRTSLTSA